VSLREEAWKTAEYVEPSFAEKTSPSMWKGISSPVLTVGYSTVRWQTFWKTGRHAKPNTTITVSIRQRHEHAIIAVANVGEPIAAEHLDRLFERFYRIDSSRTRSDTHHGLGLSIVRAVALMHRGDVFARSENGINTFGLSLAIGKTDADEHTVGDKSVPDEQTQFKNA
jgi:two-component system heavy metal sensor histidine kinase CusS